MVIPKGRENVVHFVATSDIVLSSGNVAMFSTRDLGRREYYSVAGRESCLN